MGSFSFLFLSHCKQGRLGKHTHLFNLTRAFTAYTHKEEMYVNAWANIYASGPTSACMFEG